MQKTSTEGQKVKLIENGNVISLLIDLVYSLGLEIGNGSPNALNDVLQKEWVKAKEGTFRAQLGGRFPTEEEMVLLRRLGADAIPIDFGVAYAGTLFLGATLKAVARRIQFLRDAELNRFGGAMIPQPVYYLGSGRRLDPKLEMPEHVPAILSETLACFNSQWEVDASIPGRWPQTESDMMERVHVWCGNITWSPRPVLAPDVPTVDCAKRPANTAETVRAWSEYAGPGHYLIVSSQPFCENQRMAVERAVRESGKEGYTFDVCGPEAPPLPLSRWLDNLAKQLWEEVQLLPK